MSIIIRVASEEHTIDASMMEVQAAKRRRWTPSPAVTGYLCLPSNIRKNILLLVAEKAVKYPGALFSFASTCKGAEKDVQV